VVLSCRLRKPGDLDTDDLFRFRPELGYDACMLRTRLAVIVDLIETKGVHVPDLWRHLGVRRAVVYKWLNEYNNLGVDTRSLGFRCQGYMKRNRPEPIILTEDPNGTQIEEYRRQDPVDEEDDDDTR
jgi:hypothetical protein